MANGNKRDPLLQDDDWSNYAPPKSRSQPLGYVDPAIFAGDNPYAAALNFGTEELPDFIGQGVLDQDSAAVASMPAEPRLLDYAGYMRSKQRGYSFESPTKKGEPAGAAGRTSRTKKEGGGLSEGQLLGLTGALAGGAALSQYLLAKEAGKTSQDALNQQRLTELRAKEAELKGQAAGKMSAADRQELDLLESAQMNPVRALATQQMQRGEAERASMGATRAARQALESERIGRQQVTQAAQQVGLQKAQRVLQQRAEKKAELARTQREIDERTAYESSMQRAPLEALGNTITGVMGLAGTVLGGYIPRMGAPSTNQRADFRRMYPEFATLPDSTVDAAIEGLTAARKG